ncbi:MAG: TonB-dependent receptor [Bacteroidales bacterium]|nr:TonB-dependent receptor [Bacteroidales bacterium]
MKKQMIAAALLVLPVCVAQAQENKAERLDSAVVSASRASNATPVTFTTVGKAELSATNPMSSLPMALNLLPSVVTYNEGGTGLGNSAMTIRGSKGSQINVTLNGITLNDAESQEVFWVNIPALTSLISNVQVQRGLGTSANGAGAFGASINMNTGMVQAKPSARIEMSGGSYKTFVTSVAASSGLLPGGVYFDLAWNVGATEGYIRNADVYSNSLFAALGWMGGRNSLKLTYLMGDQCSGITWDGIDLDTYKVNRTYNGAGEYYDENGNVRYYPNQTDNYRQHHLQLNWTHAFSGLLRWTNTLNYTRGDGYDEYYKMNRKLQNFGINGGRSDMTYRKKMDNDLWVLNSDLIYTSALLDVTAGVNLSSYRGGHFGEVLWVKTLGEISNQPQWYSNTGTKREVGAFVRSEYKPLRWLTAYADLQLRSIFYDIVGIDDDFLEYGAQDSDRFDYRKNWLFFNPRAGLTASFGGHKLYASAAFGHREPGRPDIKENIKGDGLEIKPEKMLDIEAGYQFASQMFTASVNLYAMEYWDMLLETGRLSGSGYPVKENVPRSWRRGIEMALAVQPWKWMRLDGNATLSMNQIADYTSYIQIDDYSGRTHAVNYGKTTMLMSPSLIGMARLFLMPWKNGVLSIDGKYVGKQFLDNSMREELAVPAYFVAGLSAGYTFDLPVGKLAVSAYVNNLLNNLYYAAGWRWESYNEDSGRIDTGIGVYPQAPRNFMIKLSYSF